ncbi:MAG: hydroxyacylglutathione hydrolase [Pseudomonadota bacterium]
MPDIIPIPAFNDNYIWILHDQQYAVVVDPGDAAPARAYLDAHQLQLAAILCTHRHHDHVDGICELAQLYNAPVYGPSNEIIPGRTQPVSEGDAVQIAELGLELTVLDIPGHTRGHIAYLFSLPGKRGVFCGDTLFGCGCGRLFDGTITQLFRSLQRLASLPDDTLVYCAHEYTEANIRFALTCEPHNPELQQRRIDARALRATGRPTLPSTIALEKATNPFLRYSVPEIVRKIEIDTGHPLPLNDALAVFTALREERNHFH